MKRLLVVSFPIAFERENLRACGPLYRLVGTLVRWYVRTALLHIVVVSTLGQITYRESRLLHILAYPRNRLMHAHWLIEASTVYKGICQKC